MSSIPVRLRDPHLRVEASRFAWCVPVRVALGCVVAWGSPAWSSLPWMQWGSLLILLFFVYKKVINPVSWKNYERTLYVYGLIAVLTHLQPYVNFSEASLQMWCGFLIIVDALMGQQSYYIARHYLPS